VQYSEDAAPLVKRLTAGLLKAPDDAEAYHQRGHAFERLRRYAEAIADFTRALVIRPDDHHVRSSRGIVYESLKRYAPAHADFEASAAADASLTPHLARACNNLAWQLATGLPAGRDPARAVDLARRAVALAPEQAAYLKTLGVAVYRAGWNAEAIEVLERSLAAGHADSEAYDLFVLAMARHRLGQVEAASTDLARAVRSVEGRKSLTPDEAAELKAFHAEAKAVLAGPSGELPADVFAPQVRD
jgi:tetratricopeptide (TPR) repeat protein